MWQCETFSWIELSLENIFSGDWLISPRSNLWNNKSSLIFLPTQIPPLMGWFGLFCPAWHPHEGPHSLVRNSVLLRRPGTVSAMEDDFLPAPQTVLANQVAPAGLRSWTQHWQALQCARLIEPRWGCDRLEQSLPPPQGQADLTSVVPPL